MIKMTKINLEVDFVRLVFLGAPGVGKGTQSKLISKNFNITHISTGDLFRTNISNNTILGNKAKGYIAKGELVPDELTLSMVKERINKNDCLNGFILDGFPRNYNQARELDSMLNANRQSIDMAILLDLPKQMILDRIAGRRFCINCGAAYHLKFNPPSNGRSCDCCGEELSQRQDDKEEVVLERLQIFDKTSKPIIDYYSSRGIMFKTIGDDDIENVFQNICKYLKAM
jgi:adenylate kinase